MRTLLALLLVAVALVPAAPAIAAPGPMSWGSTADAPVADAAESGDREAVRALLREGADVNAAQGDGMTALHWAAQRGDAEMARLLLYAGADPGAGTRIGRYTPLHLAARSARRAVAVLLLEAGADPMARTTNSGATPLHLAAAGGDARIVRALLEAGAEVEVREDAWSQTPLVFAAAENRVEAVRALLAAGADPDAPSRAVDVREWAQADRLAARRLREALEDFQEQEGGGPDWQPSPSQVQAAIVLSPHLLRSWPADAPVEPGRDDAGGEGWDEPSTKEAADTTEASPETPEEATDPKAEAPESEGQPVTGSPEADAEPDEEEERVLSYPEQVEAWGGLTPLLHAVRQGHEETARALLEGGADLDLASGDGTTPLMMAALNGHWDLARVLLDRGADPNRATVAGATPLYAVLERQWQPKASYSHPVAYRQQETSHVEMLEALLEAGADPDVRLNRHLWYMEYTFSVLGGSGIYVKGATPFWRAAYALDVPAMRLLLAYGADPDVPTLKPPERRRPPDDPDEEEEEGGEPAEGAAADSTAVETAEAPGEVPGQEPTPPTPEVDEEDDEEKEASDPSGLIPVPTDGPNILPIHAASGVGYGQSFAGNAHRHAPGAWMDAVRFLVEEVGADVNARDASGYTPLHHAASRGDDEMIRYLVSHGADVTAVSRQGQTTADMANGPIQRQQPFPSTIALLESLGSENNHNCLSC